MARHQTNKKVILLDQVRKDYQDQGLPIPSVLDQIRQKSSSGLARLLERDAVKSLCGKLASEDYRIDGAFLKYMIHRGYAPYGNPGQEWQLYWRQEARGTRYISNHNFRDSKPTLCTILLENDSEMATLETRFANKVGSIARLEERGLRPRHDAIHTLMTFGVMGMMASLAAYAFFGYEAAIIAGAMGFGVPLSAYLIGRAGWHGRHKNLLPSSIACYQIDAAEDVRAFFKAAFREADVQTSRTT